MLTLGLPEVSGAWTVEEVEKIRGGEGGAYRPDRRVPLSKLERE